MQNPSDVWNAKIYFIQYEIARYNKVTSEDWETQVLKHRVTGFLIALDTPALFSSYVFSKNTLSQ